MELAEVSEFRSPYLSIREVVQYWEVSERTLRRRLASGAPDCHQDETGQWRLSAQWIDSKFHRRRARQPFFADHSEFGETTADNRFESDDDEIDLTDDPITPQERWVQELVTAEHRATEAETELKLRMAEIDRLRTELLAARSDLNYERSLVNRLKGQLRD